MNARNPVDQGLTADADRLYTLVGGLTAYDLRTGALLWRTAGVRYVPDNVIVRDGRVLVAEAVARALDPATGAELWRFAPDTAATARSAADERAFYIGTSTGRVYALDVATGRPFWSVDLLPDSRNNAFVHAIVVHGDTVYASLIEDASPTGHLKRGWMFALDRRTGTTLWRYLNERANESHDASSHTVAGRILLVNDRRGGAFMGLDRNTGQEIWRHIGRVDLFGARDDFKVADGVAYLASNDTNVYAIDPETGRIIWQKELKGSASSSAVCGDHVFASMGSLHMLRRADGVEVANLFLDRDGFVEPGRFVVSRLLAHQGRVYFVGYDGVYAVECG